MGFHELTYSRVHLANPSAIKQYERLKHSDDKHDTFFLAQLLILGNLPQSYLEIGQFYLEYIYLCKRAIKPEL
jgi:hypothetical protein